jgi:hypothetical protein
MTVRFFFEALIILLVVSMVIRIASSAGWIRNPTAARIFKRVGQFGSALNRFLFVASFVALLVIVIFLLAHTN